MSVGYKSTFDDFMEYVHEHPSGFTVRQAALSLGVSRQTIYNHINRSRTILGVALDCEDGRYWLPGRYQDDLLRQFSLTSAEAAALVTAVEGVERLTPLAQQALRKIRKRSETTIRQDLDGPRVTYFHSYDQIAGDLFERLNAAIRTQRAVLLTYSPAYPRQPDLGFTQYRFDPLHIIYWNSHFYLVGFNHKADLDGDAGLVHLRLDRIEKCTLSRERFARPNDFDPQEYVEATFGPFRGNGPLVDVVLEFPADKAKAAVGTIRHFSQTHELLADGRAILRMRLPLTRDLVWWAVSWPGVCVREPEALRNMVIEHAQKVLEVNQ